MDKQAENLLRRIALSPDWPVQAGPNWASRNTSIATGTSGIWLAIFEAETSNVELDSLSFPISDIFSAEFLGDHGSFQITSPAMSDKLHLGDIFEGFCAAVWTSLVTRTTGPKKFVVNTHGSVDRPGLAHGETIRELCKVIAQGADESLLLTEMEQVQGVGWCNGRSGIVAAKLVQMSTKPLDATERDLIVKESWLILEEVRQHYSAMEVGLCHGSMGALVVVNGAGRLLDSPAITSAAKDLSRTILSSPSVMNIHKDYLVDASWLTGVAGLLWGARCMLHPPVLNPLLPIDSRQYEDPLRS
jgi:hypothetical protein